MESLPLRDIHLPEPVGWWPPAIGWWLLLILIPLLLAGLVWLVRYWRRVTPAKLALRELEALRAAAAPPDEKLRRLSILVRRIALSFHPRDEIAGLVGDAWLRWLDGPLGTPRFSQGPGRLLAEAPYRPAPDADVDELLKLCRDWLKALSKTRPSRHALPSPDRKTSQA